ncbi:short-chain dehydrogenase [Mycena albidolilacea]|uniref:Short-chain dehydrogenase n=1 Tax=Mycena albidolilacea TaxID=1033008 RepID=A0AAD7EH28_9AGAR|nr:short-chain dehydrogenase [Mycena albidolilacea]
MTYIRFLREQWGDIPLSTPDLSKRAVLLTRAGSRLGLHAATHLASMHPQKLLLTHRNSFGIPSSLIALLKTAGVSTSFLDLTSFASVKKLEADARDVDTFVGNAATVTWKFAKTEDGWETLNYLSNALLCILLLPRLIRNGSPETPSRVILLSSDGHHFVNGSKLPTADSILDTMNDPAYCTPRRDDFCAESNRTNSPPAPPPSTPISTMNVNPDFCYSRLTRETESTLLGKLLVGAFKAVVARPTEVGSRPIVHAVVAPPLEARSPSTGRVGWWGRRTS